LTSSKSDSEPKGFKKEKMKSEPQTEAALHRAWVRQLYEEHRTVCWQYRVSLDRPLIELTAANATWGSWEPRSRTIRLAARLVTDHTWDVVINILKHEMAHQIVTTFLKADNGHGAAFQQACDLIGVPAPFRTAGGDIPRVLHVAYPAGSREELMLAKVRKLLALAESANEHEAGLAMQKANELIAKYNLERLSEQRQARYVYCIINHRAKRLENYQRHICRILIDHFFVEVVFSHLYDPQQDATHRTIELIGTSENVAIAEYVYEFLRQQLESLWGRYRNQTNAAGRSKRSYWLGVLNGFDEKLRQTKTNGAVGRRLERALVCAAGDPQLAAFKASRFPRISLRKHGPARLEEPAFTAGLEEGRKLTLRKGVNEQDGNQGRLLSR